MPNFIPGAGIFAVLIGGIIYIFLNNKGSKRSSDSSEKETSGEAGLPKETLDNGDADFSKGTVADPVSTTGTVGSALAEKTAGVSNRLLREAKNRAKEILLEAKDKALKTVRDAEASANKIKSESMALEKELIVRGTRIDSQKEDIKNREDSLNKLRDTTNKKKEDIEALYEEQKRKLQQVSSLTREEAREILLKRFDSELVEEKAKKIRLMEKKILEESEEKSREILLEALAHGSTDYVVEHTTSKVKLPDPDMKGRIIGKEGRNIMTFEKLSGVELDLDASQGEITVSCFDSVRREIGKIALERLIADGRIQPARIEDIINQTKKDIDHIIRKEGDKLCHMLGVYDLPKEVVQTLGKFKYRFSYGQSMIKHTLEVAKIGMVLAKKLGADVEIVRTSCLLHDIGKVLIDGTGSHVDVGETYLSEHGIPKEVIVCVKEHHDDKYSSVESAIVSLADHISGARPGARSEDYESFIKRMTDLEEAATSFDGVEKAYAISSGREVRVFVKPTIVDDASTALLAREIARKIELEQTYPGVVTVTVIRETRKTETAR